MRIAMISTPFVRVPPKDYGGTELVISELVEGLVARGHDVTLFATGDSTSNGELRHMYDIAQWPPRGLVDLNHTSWAMREAQRGEYDVIHAHSAAALALTRWVEDPPLVYTIHHVRTDCLSAFYSHFPNAAYVAISADQSSREIPLPDLTIIHHGLAPTRYEWSRSAADYVAFVGRFAEVKGVHTAIDVAGAAGVRIKVAGSVHPPDAEYGDREVQPRLAQEHVEYMGGIGMDAKIPLLRDARALLVPINWNEPFGLIIAEAMLSGCPVVAFPRGSVPELVENGVTGFIVNTEQEMADVIRAGGPLDNFDRRQCRARAVERFGRDRMVAEYEALYDRLMAPRRRGLQIA